MSRGIAVRFSLLLWNSGLSHASFAPALNPSVFLSRHESPETHSRYRRRLGRARLGHGDARIHPCGPNMGRAAGADRTTRPDDGGGQCRRWPDVDRAPRCAGRAGRRDHRRSASECYVFGDGLHLWPSYHHRKRRREGTRHRCAQAHSAAIDGTSAGRARAFRWHLKFNQASGGIELRPTRRRREGATAGQPKCHADLVRWWAEAGQVCHDHVESGLLRWG